MKLEVFVLVSLLGASSGACGGSSSQASSITAPTDITTSSEDSETDATAVAIGRNACPRTAEELAAALRTIASHDVPPATAEDLVTDSEWSAALREWNLLQSERQRVAEGATTPGVSGRHRIWVHALRASRAALEQGPFDVQLDAEHSGYFQAGQGDRDSLTVRVAREGDCLRIDER